MTRSSLGPSFLAFVGAVAFFGCAGSDPTNESSAAGAGGAGGGGHGHVASSGASVGHGGTGASTADASSGSDSGTGGAGGAGPSTTASSGAGTGGGPCKTTCGGTECGTMTPDNCGGTIDCGDCGDNTDYCIKLDPPVFRDAVHAAIVSVQGQHPEFFDFNDSLGGDSYRVLDLLGFRDALVSTLVGEGYDAIPDPNSDEEIRIRGAADNAENYDVYTSGGYSAYTYTSTCTPANF